MRSQNPSRSALCFLLFLVLLSATTAQAQVIQWDNAGAGIGWGTGGNWLGNVVPAVSETALFTDIGSVGAPFVATVELDQSRTVGSLVYQNNIGQFHALDLNGFTLSLDDSLSVGVFLDTTVFAALANGDLEIGNPGALGNLSVGWNFLPGTHAAGILDLSGVNQFTGDLDQLLVGQAENGTSQGTLMLAQTNVIDATSIKVGNAVQSDNAAFTSILTLGTSNTITAGEFIVGGTRSQGLVDIPVAGVLTLGTVSDRSDLVVGRNEVGGTADTSVGIMDLSGSTFNAHLSDLVVGLKIGNGSAAADGTLLGGNAGAIHVGAFGAKGNVRIGQRLTSGTGTGVVDFSSQDSFTAVLDEMTVGQGGTGTLSLPATNTIEANTILIGDNASGTLHLGAVNTIEADDVSIGNGTSNATVDMISGVSLALGTALRRAHVSIADQNKDAISHDTATLDLTGASFNAFLDGLVVGKRTGTGSGNTTGNLVGAAGGTVNLGDAGNSAPLIIGRAEGGGTGKGTVDFGGLDEFTANVNEFQVGVNSGGTSAIGTFGMAAVNSIDANSIVWGDMGNATVHLGLTNEIVADTVIVGARVSNSTVDIPFGGSLTLGSPSKRAVVSIADQDKDSSSNHTATVDLTGATFNANLNGLIVGRRIGGGSGNTTGSLHGPSGGIVSIGESGNAAQILVGIGDGGGTGNGTVDFGGLDEFTANLDEFMVGVRSGGTNANGTFSMAADTTIDANIIVFGDRGTATIHLGQTNEIVADTVVIASGESNATIDIPFGGSFTLGSPSKRADVSIADQDKGTSSTHTATIDLTGATFNAFLNGLIVARRDGFNIGDTHGNIFGASGGSVSIGTTGNVSQMIIGRTDGGNRSNGNVDFGGLDSFDANLDELQIGVRASGTSAAGTLSLAAENTIDANSIVIGDSGTATVHLGETNEIVADTLVMGSRDSNATMDIPIGGSLTLGSPSKRTDLSIADQTKDTSSTHTVTIDLTGATFNAYLSGLLVAQRAGTNIGQANGSIVGATGGTVSIGTSGNVSQMVVARAESGNSAIGTVDFSGLDSFTADLNQLQIGVRNGGTGAIGMVLLGASSEIDANEFLIGKAGTGTLDLGANAVVDVDLIKLADGGNGTLIFNGGELAAGLIQDGGGNATFEWNNGILHVDQFGTSSTPFDLVNEGTGTLAPGNSVGSTIVYGDYHQGEFASLEIEIDSSVAFDVVDIDEDAFLDGTLAVDFVGTFTPTVGDSYEIMTFASRSGVFSNLICLGVVGDAFVEVAYKRYERDAGNVVGRRHQQGQQRRHRRFHVVGRRVRQHGCRLVRGPIRRRRGRHRRLHPVGRPLRHDTCARRWRCRERCAGAVVRHTAYYGAHGACGIRVEQDVVFSGQGQRYVDAI